jgi:hypothetical protein
MWQQIKGKRPLICNKSRKRPRKSDELMMGPIIKDIIINKEEHRIHNEYEKLDSWGFKAIDEFFQHMN